MVEVLMVVGVIALLSGIGTVIVTDLRSNANQVRVNSGLKNLNSAVAAYLTNGGILPEDANINEVIAKLKTVKDTDVNDGSVGLNGSFVDRRLSVEQSDEFEVGIRWNADRRRFEEDSSDQRFQIVLLDQESAIVAEERNGSTLQWGENWIWEFSEEAETDYKTPTVFTINNNPDIPLPDFDGPSVSINPVDNDVLTVGLNGVDNADFEFNNGFNDRNTTFGNPNRGPVAYNTAQENVQGWSTTASDGLIEVWQSGFLGVDAFSGNFFVEFNANEVSTLFQEVNVAGSDFVNISFAHGQRSRNTEQLKLLVGTNAPATRTSANQVEDLESQGFVEILTTNTDSVGGFTLYQDRYDLSNLPEGTETLFFAFQSVGEFSTRSVGNFLDDVRFEGATAATVSGFQFDIGSGTSNSNVIRSARVILTEAEFEDTLSVGELNQRFEVETTFGDGTIEITITGTAPRHEYAEILSGIAFSTTSSETHDRVLTFQVNDGFALSEPVEYLVEFD